MYLERLRTAGGGLVGRFASNALRQTIGAGLFFVTTLLLTRGMGNSGYAQYFLDWNLAQILVSVVSFGLYNETIRRLATGDALGPVVRGLIAPHLLQLSVLALAAWAIAHFTRSDSTLVFLVAAATSFGSLLTALSLGRDAFRTFIAGEMLHNIALLVFVALAAPHSPRTVGYIYLAAAFVKLAYYAIDMKRSSTPHPGHEPSAQKNAPQGGDYALRTYGHSLLQILTFRSFVLVSGYLLPPGGMDALAVIWSFCDRALTLVQGINQIVYPKLIAGSISARLRMWTNLGTSVGYLLAVLGMTTVWLLLGHLGLTAPVQFEYSAFGLCIAFLPHVLRLLKMTEALAESRFRTLYSSHALALLGIVLVGGTLFATEHGATWKPPLLIFTASSLGLLVFYVLGKAKPGDPTKQGG